MTDMNLPITGGCLCGAVRFSTSAPPVVTRQCWCRTCQFLGAGSSTVNAVFRTADVNMTGEVKYFRSQADSGNMLVRGFCPACGTPLTSQAEVRPYLLILRTGTLDDPTVVKPAMDIWTGSAPAWACLDPDLPQVAGQPPPAA